VADSTGSRRDQGGRGDAGQSAADSPGLIGSLREAVGSAVAALQTRLELLSADAQEAGWRLAAIAIYAVVALFCLFVGTVLFALLLIVAFWDRSPTLAVGLLSGFFLLASVVCALLARSYARARPGLFAATLDTLARDREALAARRAGKPAAADGEHGAPGASGERAR
jgi:uncharacterized membrane protein YqjE